VKTKIFCSTWGMASADPRKCFEQAKRAGFDGIEMGVPADMAACVETRRRLDDCGLPVVVQQWTQGKTPAEHIDSFKKQFERSISLKPQLVNSHTGRDWFSLEQNLAVFDCASELERSSGVTIVHETHRNRALFCLPATIALLDARPELKLTADFSHWCCVHESLLQDQQASVSRAMDRAFYIHARVGHSEGPQVPDPREATWQPAVEAHVAWWREIIRRRADASSSLAFCVEFGPPTYQTVYPGMDNPTAVLWDINCSMKQLLERTVLSQ
jgi:sugar phosphate isomerase/epimerase